MPHADPAARVAYQREYQRVHRARYAENAKRDREKLRLDVLSHYANGVPACACCDERALVFLTLDHIEGGGNAARRSTGSKGGTQYYRHLRRAGFPPGYRVLCWNCNAAYAITGTCPHRVHE